MKGRRRDYRPGSVEEGSGKLRLGPPRKALPCCLQGSLKVEPHVEVTCLEQQANSKKEVPPPISPSHCRNAYCQNLVESQLGKEKSNVWDPNTAS